MDKIALGSKIRDARLKKALTQQQLADKAQIGSVYLGEIERGIKMPSMHIFIRIVEALEISADYILRDELSTGQCFIYDEITEKLKKLNPKQRKVAADLLDAYLKNID